MDFQRQNGLTQYPAKSPVRQPNEVEEHGKLGVVFQDSSHHYEASRKEWNLYSQLLDENAIWIADDITKDFWDKNIDPPGKGMVQYFEELPGEKRLYPYAGSNCQGIILLP